MLGLIEQLPPDNAPPEASSDTGSAQHIASPSEAQQQPERQQLSDNSRMTSSRGESAERVYELTGSHEAELDELRTAVKQKLEQILIAQYILHSLPA